MTFCFWPWMTEFSGYGVEARGYWCVPLAWSQLCYGGCQLFWLCVDCWSSKPTEQLSKASPAARLSREWAVQGMWRTGWRHYNGPQVTHANCLSTVRGAALYCWYPVPHRARLLIPSPTPSVVGTPQVRVTGQTAPDATGLNNEWVKLYIF